MEAPNIDWSWCGGFIVPAYYERALAPMRGLPPVGARISEVGVGCGDVLSKLTLSCRGQGIGVDNDRQAMVLSRRVAAFFGVRIQCVRTPGGRLPFADEALCVVYSHGFIEHFPASTSERLVAGHVRVLRPGGLLALSVPNLLSPFHTWRTWRGEARAASTRSGATPREASPDFSNITASG